MFYQLGRMRVIINKHLHRYNIAYCVSIWLYKLTTTWLISQLVLHVEAMKQANLPYLPRLTEIS